MGSTIPAKSRLQASLYQNEKDNKIDTSDLRSKRFEDI